jgi:hypothetical protein
MAHANGKLKSKKGKHNRTEKASNHRCRERERDVDEWMMVTNWRCINEEIVEEDVEKE